MAGVDHTEAPAKPQFVMGWSLAGAGVHCLALASGIVYVCHSMLPEAASSDTTLPRKVQHGKPSSLAKSHSLDDTPTTTRPSRTTGFEVMAAYFCFSTCFTHRSEPSARLTEASHA